MRFSTYIFVIFLFSCKPNSTKTVFDPLKEQTDIEIYLSDYGLESVPQEIRILKNVKRLYIAKDTSGWVLYPPLSTLTQDKSTRPSRYLPNEISELSNLTSLTLVNLDLVSLPENIDQLEKLDTLILFMNKLTISSELEKLKKLRRLKYLGLLGNDLTANDLIELKRAIPGITINPDLR
jgi:Leucine-rich repeat (LRR) protein